MLKKLVGLKMALAAMVLSVGMAVAPSSADASCVNNFLGRYLVCFLYIDHKWEVFVQDALDL